MQIAKTHIHKLFSEPMIKAINEKGGFFVAGGFFTSKVTRKDVNDVDIYFVNKESLSEFIKWIKDDTHWCTFISDKSLNYCVDGEKLQLIHYEYYNSLQEIWNHYDFTINMAGWDSRTDEVEMHENFLIHNSQRYLHFNPNTLFPLISALRVQKMLQRGYYIPKNQFVKIMLAVSQLDMKSWEDFKSHCGALYGLNYVTNEIIGDKEFSIENALEVVENTSFDNKPVSEYKIDPRVVDFVLGGNEVEYIKLANGDIKCVADCEDLHVLNDMVVKGSIKAKQLTLKEYLGDYVYKWVTPELRSHYRKSFQYKLNEWVYPEEASISTYSDSGKLFFSSEEGLKDASYSGNGIILKCKYEEEDLIDFTMKECITFKKIYPVEIITDIEKFKRSFL